jgi:superfamily II DNA or RNA helicase
LATLGRDLGIELPPGSSKEEQLARLERTELAIDRLLPRLTRDELRAACRAQELDPRGRSRLELMSRLLGDEASALLEPADGAGDRRLAHAQGLPHPGDIAAVQHRQYLVEDVVRGDPGQDTLVRLTCLDDDAPGRPHQVIWERELGARVIAPEEHGLGAIDRLDPPRHLAAYLHALKWNAVTATDAELFQAPFRAGIQVFNHQLVPLMKALSLPRANLFIADDVGLGKTIEAGLVVQELLLRQQVDRIVIACPAAVALQWRGEMLSRFGLRFEIYNRAFVARRRRERGFAVNPWTTYPRFIISYQTLRRHEYRDPLLAELGDRSAKSLLILDEAHNAAPASAAKYAVDSRTTRVIRDIAPRFEHRLFLSATPHNGHSNSFSSLLEILDPQRFTRGVPVAGSGELEEVMIRRLKSDIRALGSDVHYPEREVIQIDLTHEAGSWIASASGKERSLGKESDAELVLADKLRDYARLVGAGTRSKRKRLALVNLQKRLLSSVDAFYRTLRVHARTVAGIEAEALAAPDPDSVRTTAEGIDGEEYGQTDEAAEREAEIEAALDARQLPSPDDQARELLADMLAIAASARVHPGPKTLALIDWIREKQCAAARVGGAASGTSAKERAWSDRRVLVFTEYGDTKRHLRQILSAAIAGTDAADERIMEFHGGMTDEQREEVQRAFNGPPAEHPVRILLCTDAAREGVNLQGHCADLFHYDLPWNPSRMEQRNGRIDRTLQRAAVVCCHYFVYPQRVEDRVLSTVIGKVATIERELGSLGLVLADQLAASLELGIDEDAEARVAQSSLLEELISAANIDFAAARGGEKHRADAEAAARILNRSQDFASFSPEHLLDALNVALELAGAGPLEPAGIESPAVPASGAFRVPAMPESWTPALDILRPPQGRDEPLWEWRKKSPRPVLVDPPRQMTSELVHLHLEHPLVKRLLSRFLAQGFAASDLSRVTAVKNPRDNLVRVIAFGRLSLYGRGAVRLHEELVPIAARWLEGRGELRPFAEEADKKAVDQLEALLAAGPALDLSKDVQSRLLEAAPRDFATLWAHVRAEADARETDAREKLRARAADEARKLAAILERQKAAIARRITEARQLDLFAGLGDSGETRRQRQQLEQDLAHMDRRLGDIDREMETEPEALAGSFQVVLRRLEPVGLVYLWPATR